MVTNLNHCFFTLCWALLFFHFSLASFLLFKTMVYTKKVVVKNHTSFFATESESLYSPSPMIQKDKGKGIIDVIEVISCSDSKNTILRTPPHAKGVAIGSLKKKVISQKEKQGQQRRRSDFEEPHLLKDKATKRNSRPTGKTKKVVFGRFRDLKVIKKYGWDILCFVKKQKSTEFVDVQEPIYPRLKSFLCYCCCWSE